MVSKQSHSKDKNDANESIGTVRNTILQKKKNKKFEASITNDSNISNEI